MVQCGGAAAVACVHLGAFLDEEGAECTRVVGLGGAVQRRLALGGYGEIRMV